MLSSSALTLVDQHGMSPSELGYIWSASTAVGVAVMLWTARLDEDRAGKDSSELTTTVYSALFSPPFDTVLIVLFLGGWTVAFGAGNKTLSIAAIAAIYIADYLAFSMVNEVVATNSPPSSASSFLALGKGLNLMAYMVMGYAGPVMYGISASMPYTISGVFILCWAAALWIVLYLRAVVILSVDDEDDEDEKRVRRRTRRHTMALDAEQAGGVLGRGPRRSPGFTGAGEDAGSNEHEGDSKRRSSDDGAPYSARVRNPITIFSAFTGSMSWRECEHLYRVRQAAKKTEMTEIKQLDTEFAVMNLSGRCQHMESTIKEQQAMLRGQQETIDRLASRVFPSDDHFPLRSGHSGLVPSAAGQKTHHIGSRVVPRYLDTITQESDEESEDEAGGVGVQESDEESEDEAGGVLVESLPTSQGTSPCVLVESLPHANVGGRRLMSSV